MDEIIYIMIKDKALQLDLSKKLSRIELEVEYFEIVDDISLVPVRQKSEFDHGKRYFGCIAVKAGKIRLIDNIEISLF